MAVLMFGRVVVEGCCSEIELIVEKEGWKMCNWI